MKIYPSGTYIKVNLDAGFAGTDTYFYVLLKRDFTEDELNDTMWDIAKNHAEMYGVYPEEEYTEEEIAENPDSYSHNIEGYFEVVEKENVDEADGLEEWD